MCYDAIKYDNIACVTKYECKSETLFNSSL